MMKKGQWVVIPYRVAHWLQGLRLIPPSVKVERDIWPLWLGYYSFNITNAKTLPLTNVDSMYYSCALDRMLR